MELYVLGSGSSGNAYVLSAGDESLLLEAGVGMTELRKADFRKLVGCAITHEHNDHSARAQYLLEHGIPVAMSKGTADALSLDGSGMPLRIVAHGESVNLGSFTLTAFDTAHDAVEPLGYVVQYRPTGEKLLFVTDSWLVETKFPAVHYWMVECNYTDEMLNEWSEENEVAQALKHRLYRSHMSLRHLLMMLDANDLSRTRTIVLLHLSDTRSDETRMVKEVSEHTGIETIAASNGVIIDLGITPF